MSEGKQPKDHLNDAVSEVILAQKHISAAGSALFRANKLSKHIPEYKEIEQLVIRLGNLARALQKLVL